MYGVMECRRKGAFDGGSLLPSSGHHAWAHVAVMLPWSGRGPQRPVPGPSPQTAAAADIGVAFQTNLT